MNPAANSSHSLRLTAPSAMAFARAMNARDSRALPFPELGKLKEFPELGGLHHHYERLAAQFRKVLLAEKCHGFMDRTGVDNRRKWMFTFIVLLTANSFAGYSPTGVFTKESVCSNHYRGG
jgi:hypothetical protein